MTMPLNAMPQAAQDLIRQQTAAAVGNAATVIGAQPYGGSTLAVNSPADAAWLPQQQQQQAPAPQAAPMQQQPMPQQPMPGMQGQAMPPQQQGGGGMLPTPYGGFQAVAPGQAPMQQVGAQPGYSGRPPPESSVVVPKSKTGLIVVLALVGLLVVGGVVALVLYLPRHGGTASATPETKPDTTQSAAAPPPSTTAASTTPPPASTGAATAAPPVETQDSGAAAASGSGDGAAPLAQGADAGTTASAELTIVCVPDCDSVKIDDKALDTGDAGLVPTQPTEIAIGPHTIAVGRATYLAQTKKVTIKAGQKAKETFYLTKPGAVPVARPCGKFLERCPN
jgi:hypothetical protein